MPPPPHPMPCHGGYCLVGGKGSGENVPGKGTCPVQTHARHPSSGPLRSTLITRIELGTPSNKPGRRPSIPPSPFITTHRRNVISPSSKGSDPRGIYRHFFARRHWTCEFGEPTGPSPSAGCGGRSGRPGGDRSRSRSNRQRHSGHRHRPRRCGALGTHAD